ncbi:hypothetical protein CPB84DRAFT_1754735 [Gymnopilus junonius]|uniref:Uncharacterized protein n=1 Tax=Gymnopilus junonius TaxID=109634 RepID=A0A9P5TEM2_GYMJU|nr:hypothetical protein CPB84DRAFT_1754735 [Gymnopilus junonius]
MRDAHMEELKQEAKNDSRPFFSWNNAFGAKPFEDVMARRSDSGLFYPRKFHSKSTPYVIRNIYQLLSSLHSPHFLDPPSFGVGLKVGIVLFLLPVNMTHWRSDVGARHSFKFIGLLFIWVPGQQDGGSTPVAAISTWLQILGTGFIVSLSCRIAQQVLAQTIQVTILYLVYGPW